jgi:AcrR family transcriptional regulator
VAAFDLVDAEGAAALTIARLARELGVGPMTIYGHAESKDAILAMLPDLLLENLPSVHTKARWDSVLEVVFVAIYRLDEAGFTIDDAFELRRTLATYTLGCALFAIVETRAGTDRPRSAWAHDLDAAEFPYLAGVSARTGAEFTESQYVAGLRRILRSSS